MSEVTYRHWRPGDDAGVMRLLAPQGWCTPERYASKFDDPGLQPADVLIAERADRIVGHLMLPHRRVRFGQTTLPVGGIGMVVVDPEARGHGVGARLLEAALAHHRAAGEALVGLYTMRSLTPAFAMYQRRGFTVVMERIVLHLPRHALGAADGLTGRPAREEDRPALARLLEAWAIDHRGISTEIAADPLTDAHAIARADGAVVGWAVQPADGGTVRRLLAAPGVPVAAVLAALAAAAGMETIALATNPESRVHAELAGLATRAERDGSVFMLAPLGVTRALAGLALEIAGHLRRQGAAPVAATLTLAGSDEAVRLDWDGQVLAVDAPPTREAPTLTLTGADLALGLSGQPAPAPADGVAALWAALFPPQRAALGYINCW